MVVVNIKVNMIKITILNINLITKEVSLQANLIIIIQEVIMV